MRDWKVLVENTILCNLSYTLYYRIDTSISCFNFQAYSRRKGLSTERAVNEDIFQTKHFLRTWSTRPSTPT